MGTRERDIDKQLVGDTRVDAILKRQGGDITLGRLADWGGTEWGRVGDSLDVGVGT